MGDGWSRHAAWLERFRAALARAAERTAIAQIENRLIACGFTSNVDRVATLDEALLAKLYGGRVVDGAGPRLAHLDSVADLLVAVAQCVAAGDGTDLIIRDPAVQDWLLERMHGRQQVGGTGAQAASTLATLGFPVLVHLTSRSPAQIATLAHRERIAIASPDGLLSVDEAVEERDPPMWHPVLEFPTGLPAPLPGEPRAPAANRILFGYDPVNANLRLDPAYCAALADPALAIDALLISGFSQLQEETVRRRVLADVAEALPRWRALRPHLFVHLELGAMPDFRAVAQALESLHPLVSSVGLNIDELRELLAVHGMTMAAPGPDLVTQLRWLRERYPTPRLSVHTRDFCLTLTDGDVTQERDALLFATLVAASRARIAAFPELNDLTATLDCAQVNRDGLRFLCSLGVEDEIDGGAGVVVTPGLAVGGAVATVGLGDSFTGGVLAMM